MNASTSQSEQRPGDKGGGVLRPPSWALTVFAMAVAYFVAGIGIGAVLQAMLGAYTIRRFVGFPARLHTEREVGSFLLLAGPVSCVVSASIGVATLYASGVIPLIDVSFSWFLWWVGDTIGAVLLTPIVLAFAGRPREIWRRRRVTVAMPLSFVLVGAVDLRFPSRFRGFREYRSLAEAARRRFW